VVTKLAMLSLGEKTSKAGPPWDDVIPIARAYIEAAPDRCVWASDCASPQPDKALENMMFSRAFCCREFGQQCRSWKRQEESRSVNSAELRAI
jgi:hypothetical protein